MCKPKPGPRCSSHAREALIKAINHHDEMKKRMNAAQRKWENNRDEKVDRKLKKELINERNLYNRSVRILRTAQWDYDTCPEGLKKLTQMVAAAEKSGNQARVQETKNRLGKAILGRKTMMREYHAMLADKKRTEKEQRLSQKEKIF